MGEREQARALSNQLQIYFKGTSANVIRGIY